MYSILRSTTFIRITNNCLIKDWRLKGSPLVQDVPFIRFYAAAPLVTSEGHVVGAFSVFDPRPKESFGLRLRQKLVNYARMAMADFRKIVDDENLLEQPQTSSSYRRIVDEDEALHSPQSSSNKVRSNTNIWWNQANRPSSNMTQAPLTKQVSALSLRRGREGARPINGFSSDDQTIIEEVHKSPARSQITSSSSNQALNITPVLPSQRTIPRRVGSSLEQVLATAKLPTPPDSPTLPQQISKIGPEDQSDNLSRGRIIPTRGAPEEVKRTTKTLDTSQLKSSAHGDNMGHTSVRSLITPPMSQHEHSPHSSGSTEAAEMITLMAQTLGWDFLYVLRILPGYPKEAEASRGEYDKLFAQLLVAHGCPDPPPTFCYSLHLRALESAGGFVYRDTGKDQSCNRVGFKVGVMLPLSRDTDGYSGKRRDSDESLVEKRSCESGLVLGAFQKKTPFDYEPSLEDIAALRESGYNLRSVLERAG